MAQATVATSIENDELICPITFQLFRDPVIANDGRVYEREAITRWIFAHGTSPFTREPLQINDLQSDEHLRHLANQRRNSTVSYNARNDGVTLPPLRRVPRNNTRVAPEQGFNQIRADHQSYKYLCEVICSVVLILIISMAITLGIVFGIKDSEPKSTVSKLPEFTSNYSSSLTNNSAVFIRPGSHFDQYYYKATQVIVSIDGFYKFMSISQIDMYGYLYAYYFNATNPSVNLLASNDDAAGSLQFYFKTSLQSGIYVLVATTYPENITGSFSIVVSGRANVTFR